MSDLQKLLYDYILIHRLQEYVDQRESERLARQILLEEEKLERLLPAEYQRLFPIRKGRL